MAERQSKQHAAPSAPSPEEQAEAPGRSPAAAPLYEQLTAPFDLTFTDVRGGVELTYITGEQCVTRLNEVLGAFGWSFRVVEHGINPEADEVWVLGEMTASDGARTIVRQQFGSQKLKRSRTSGMPLDIGFDLKGAATDALKKCASLIGVGLYLSRKESPEARAASQPESASRGASPAPRDSGPDVCEECGLELRETRFKDGTVWGPAQLAGYGRRKHGRVLCMEHYRLANEARKHALLSA